METVQKKNTTSLIVYIGLRIIMALMLAVCIIGICIDKDASMRSRYVFNATQSFLFLVASLVPKLIKTAKVEIPEWAMVVFILFCFAHFFFGEIINFYATVKWWDSMLHTLTGAMIALLSFSLVYLLNSNDKDDMHLNTLFVVLFAFCFAVVVGVLWEGVEWLADEIAGGNMQRWANSITGVPFVGREALKDTMKDLLLDSIGAAVVCTACGIIMQKTGKFSDDLIILRKPKKITILEQTEEINGESVNLTKEEMQEISANNENETITEK
jgi:hypothetical protein